MGSTVDAPVSLANVRTDTKAALVVVRRGYALLENPDAFAFCETIAGESQARYETAGSL